MKHVAIYLPTLAGGGAELSMLRLARHLTASGYRVDVVVNKAAGAHLSAVPDGISLIALSPINKWRARFKIIACYRRDAMVLLRPILIRRRTIMGLRFVQGLANYLRCARPSILIASLYQANLVAVWARGLAGIQVPIILTERNTLSRSRSAGLNTARDYGRWIDLPSVIACAYRYADAVVSVSDGVGDDLADLSGLPRSTIQTIYNPVVSEELSIKAAEPCDHRWLIDRDEPTLLSVGRLEPQKDYPTLLRAFALLVRERPLRLIILGEGSERQRLEALARDLGVADRVDIYGWAKNPYAFMRRASMLVSSSLWEGLPGVLIEALAVGCPVVATNCPSGSAEVLADGVYGRLVSVSDPVALSEAIDATLKAPPSAAANRYAVQRFSAEASVNSYKALIDRLC